MTREEFRWIGLTRVSTPGQAEDGGGLELQEAAIRKFVKGRGDRLVTILSDAGVSGTLDKMGERLAMAGALQMLNRNEADGIVVSRLDRLGRELALQEFVMQQIRKLGCVLASCDPTEDEAIAGDGDPTRRMFRQILAVFADYERLMIIARTQAGRRRKMEAGGWIGNNCAPYGYELDGVGGLREVASEMAAIAQARTMREMNATYAVIGEYFAAAGMRLRRAQRWDASTIRKLLMTAAEKDYPKAAPLDNLAKLVIGLPADPSRV